MNSQSSKSTSKLLYTNGLPKDISYEIAPFTTGNNESHVFISKRYVHYASIHFPSVSWKAACVYGVLAATGVGIFIALFFGNLINSFFLSADRQKKLKVIESEASMLNTPKVKSIEKDKIKRVTVSKNTDALTFKLTFEDFSGRAHFSINTMFLHDGLDFQNDCAHITIDTGIAFEYIS